MPAPETEVEDGLALAQFGNSGGVTAAQAGQERIGGQFAALVDAVERGAEGLVGLRAGVAAARAGGLSGPVTARRGVSPGGATRTRPCDGQRVTGL